MPGKQVKKSAKSSARAMKSGGAKKGKASAVKTKSSTKKKAAARKISRARPAVKSPAKKASKRRTPVVAAGRSRSSSSAKTSKAKRAPAARPVSRASKREPVRMKGKTASKRAGDSSRSRKSTESGDFGTPVNRALPRGRARDAAEGLPSVEQSRAGAGGVESPNAGGGDRVSGVGMPESGPGGSSGGDYDPDFVGIAGAGGLAINPPDDSFNRGDPDDEDSRGSSRQSATRHRPAHAGVVNPPLGSTVDRSGGDASTTGEGGGSASASSGHLVDFEDDAAAGEISLGEASGEDD